MYYLMIEVNVVLTFVEVSDWKGIGGTSGVTVI